jgi:NB-ARC domain
VSTGSRVLVTARDSSVLPAERSGCVRLPVLTLDEAPARQLLCWHAFATAAEALEPQQQATVQLALRICGGLPLALEVLGSALRCHEISACEVSSFQGSVLCQATQPAAL